MRSVYNYIAILLLMVGVYACASQGNPDGGPYDVTPPRFVKSTPGLNAVNVRSKKIEIEFDEYIKLENPGEKVIISPPQNEIPEVRVAGKKVIVEFADTLQPNTTYTIDFGDAIVDNNEGNPLGNFAFAFSTGTGIDTMEVSGYVLNAANLEPVKGVQVGLHKNLNDSAFMRLPFDRISRTDGSGHFTIKGIAPGKYHIFALKDGNQNYFYDSKTEHIAFMDSLVVPSSMPATRMDSVFSLVADTMRYDSVREVHYTRFLPDDLILRIFRERNTSQFLSRHDRPELNRFWLKFNMPVDTLPRLMGLNFKAEDAFVIEPDGKRDSIVYWIRDSLLCEQDTLSFALQYQATDSVGGWYSRTDTLNMVNKIPLKRRLQLAEEALKKEEKEQKKRRQAGSDTIVGAEPKYLEVKTDVPSTLDLNKNFTVSFGEPLASVDTAAIHLYIKVDSTFTPTPMLIEADSLEHRKYQILAEWQPEREYKLVMDSAAFKGIYGLVSKKIEGTTKVKKLDEYASLFLHVRGIKGKAFVQLLDNNDAVVRQADVKPNGDCTFYFLSPTKYYVRLIEDMNGNGIWDTGNYELHQQPEPVYYFPKTWEMKANFDFDETWDIHSTPLVKQKPDEIKKQKPDEQKKIRDRNRDRAQKFRRN